MASETERGVHASTTHDKIEHLRDQVAAQEVGERHTGQCYRARRTSQYDARQDRAPACPGGRAESRRARLWPVKPSVAYTPVRRTTRSSTCVTRWPSRK